jgi:hypothetical protein
VLSKGHVLQAATLCARGLVGLESDGLNGRPFAWHKQPFNGYLLFILSQVTAPHPSTLSSLSLLTFYVHSPDMNKHIGRWNAGTSSVLCLFFVISSADALCLLCDMHAPRGRDKLWPVYDIFSVKFL